MPFSRYPQTHPPLPGLGPLPSTLHLQFPLRVPDSTPPPHSTPSHQPARPHSGVPPPAASAAGDPAPEPPAAPESQHPGSQEGAVSGSGGGRRRELRTRWSELDRPQTICHHLNLNARQPPIVMLIRG